MRIHHLLPYVTLAAAQAKTAFQLEEVGTWFENLAVRPDGTVLATRMDAPEVWHIDPKKGTGSALVTVPSALSTTGITELTPDVWVFSAANMSFQDPFGLQPGSLAVWKVDLSEGDEGAAEPELVARFPDAGFLNGMATWDEKRVLVGDTSNNVVYLLDVESGEFTTALDGPEVAGVNGIRVHDGAVYAVATTSRTLFKIPVTEDVEIDGEAVVIVEGVGMDDFDIAADGTIYAASPSDNLVVKISPDGEVTDLAGGANSTDVLGPTSVRIGRGEGGENTIYVSITGNGLFGPPDAPKAAAGIVAVNISEAPAEGEAPEEDACEEGEEEEAPKEEVPEEDADEEEEETVEEPAEEEPVEEEPVEDAPEGDE